MASWPSSSRAVAANTLDAAPCARRHSGTPVFAFGDASKGELSGAGHMGAAALVAFEQGAVKCLDVAPAAALPVPKKSGQGRDVCVSRSLSEARK
eukprot:365817-Chlamydomonas_euryale.AAC.20